MDFSTSIKTRSLTPGECYGTHQGEIVQRGADLKAVGQSGTVIPCYSVRRCKA